MAESTRRAGRPTTDAIEGRKSTLSIRAAPDLKSRLVAAAERNDRSLSAEMETRLEISFLEHEGDLAAAFLLLLGNVLADVGPHAAVASTGTITPAAIHGWPNDPFAYDQAVKAVIEVLEAFRPAGALVPKRLLAPKLAGEFDINAAERNIGQGTAAGWLEAVANPAEAVSGRQQRLGEEIRMRLGREIADRIGQNLERRARKRAESEEGEEDKE